MRIVVSILLVFSVEAMAALPSWVSYELPDPNGKRKACDAALASALISFDVEVNSFNEDRLNRINDEMQNLASKAEGLLKFQWEFKGQELMTVIFFGPPLLADQYVQYYKSLVGI